MYRRKFLASLSAAAFSLKAPTQARATTIATDSGKGYDPWLEIDSERLVWNANQLSQRVRGRPILAVLKDNAYGHGLPETGAVLDALPAVYGFAVFKLQEALELRRSGISKPVLLLGPASDEQLEELVRQRITPSIFTDRGKALDRLANQLQRPIGVHLYLDTGLGRAGVPYYRALPLIEKLAAYKGIVFEGVLTALTEEDEFDREQVSRLQEVYRQAAGRGIDLGRRHAVSSAGIFHLSADEYLDMVRPGISLYGCYPDDRSEKTRQIELRPALSLKARVLYVKQLRKGDTLQYHRAYVAQKPVWIATIPVGHFDGWPRETAGKCQVLINGRMFPVVASVTANHTLVEVGEDALVKEGDEVLFFGRSGEHEISPHQVANQTGVSIYSLLMHLNPLLPRRRV